MPKKFPLERYKRKGTYKKKTPDKKKPYNEEVYKDFSGWWAIQVYSGKEYDTKREMMSCCKLGEDDILIPRRLVYVEKDGVLEKKTENLYSGYIFINSKGNKTFKNITKLRNYINILGKISKEEMDIIRSYENIPKDTEAHRGDKIIITRGPFAGIKGTIIEENEIYSKCRLVYHGNEIITDMNMKLIEKIM